MTRINFPALTKFFGALLITFQSIYGSSSQAAEELIIAAPEKFPPYSWQSPEGPRGIDIDIITEAATRIGYSLKVIIMPWDKVLRSVEMGKVHGGMPAFLRPEREAYAFYTNTPVHVSRYSIFQLKNKTYRYLGPNSLFTLKILKLSGNSFDRAIEKKLKEARVIVREVVDPETALNLLLRNRFDIFIHNEIDTLYWINHLNLGEQVNTSPQRINPGEGAFLIFSRKLNGYGQELRDTFNKSLKSMLDDGTIKRIMNSYISSN